MSVFCATLFPTSLASFALEEFETALDAFRQGQKLFSTGTGGNDPRKYSTWIRKCKAEMEAEDEPLVAAEETSSSKTATGTIAVPATSAPAHLRVRFQYYQSHERVTVALLEKGLKKDDVDMDVGERRLTVRRKEGGGLLFDKVLYESVVPEQCKTRFLPSKVSSAKRVAGTGHDFEME